MRGSLQKVIVKPYLGALPSSKYQLTWECQKRSTLQGQIKNGLDINRQNTGPTLVGLNMKKTLQRIHSHEHTTSGLILIINVPITTNTRLIAE